LLCNTSRESVRERENELKKEESIEEEEMLPL